MAATYSHHARHLSTDPRNRAKQLANLKPPTKGQHACASSPILDPLAPGLLAAQRAGHVYSGRTRHLPPLHRSTQPPPSLVAILDRRFGLV
jgi:hypothetical protein